MDIQSRFKTYSVNFVESFDDLYELVKQDESFFVIDRNVYDFIKIDSLVFLEIDYIC